MTESFTKEIKQRKLELEQAHSKLTFYWMGCKFQSETNWHIGKSLDYMNRAIAELEKLLK